MLEVGSEREDGRGNDEGAADNREKSDDIQEEPALQEGWQDHSREAALIDVLREISF